LLEKNIKIEVFLGQLDKIIDAQAVYDFFKPYATVYFIKNSGHIL
jgi:RNA recognition motif-containing protein